MTDESIKAKAKAFGLYDISTVNAINRLLKNDGLKLRVKKDYRNWGDQIEITVEKVASEQTADLRERLEAYEAMDRVTEEIQFVSLDPRERNPKMLLKNEDTKKWYAYNDKTQAILSDEYDSALDAFQALARIQEAKDE
jgi:hypothetical protein